MKKILCAILAAALTVVAFVAAGPGDRSNQLSGKKIIVADANSTHHLNLYVAYEKGFFTKRGLEVEIRQTSSGVAAVVGGEADIVFNCPTGVITPIARGQNITI
ncbi:MAG: ABC transporter substrate-binding protein, partial [Spirochaetaceae bacterium]|nr:ABC transporter substrate-binding protein [Spirochaetaceae bacterium]